MRQLHRRKSDASEVEFLGQRIKYARIAFQIASAKRLAHSCDRDLNLPGSEIRDRWDLLYRDLLFRQAFDISEESLFTGFGKRDRDALAAGTPNAANPVHIRFRCGRNVVVHDMRE